MSSHYHILKETDIVLDVDVGYGNDVPVPVPIQDGDIGPAAQTYIEAFRDDPMFKYLDADRPVNEPRRKMVFSWILRINRRSRVMSTIEHGIALVCSKPANYKPKLTDKLLEWVLLIAQLGLTKEQRKRTVEAKKKIAKAVEEAPELGDNVKDMVYVELIATRPESQGKGYGSILLRSVTVLADVLRQKTWLTSSNVKNTAFYNSHGFITVKEVILGDDNPNWEGAPVVVNLMVRNPRALPRPPWETDEKNPFLDNDF